MIRLLLLTMLALAGCASHSQIAMLNPRTGAQVGCDTPGLSTGSGEYLVSRMCLSACQAHGFRPVPGAVASGDGGVPEAYLN